MANEVPYVPYGRMNPQGEQNVLHHMLARMLPLKRWQSAVYRLAQKHPPGLEDGFTPIWECAPFSLAARATAQARINVQNQFHILAVMGSSSSGGGFRFQIYDQKKKRRLMDRGISFQNLGTGAAPFFLREPYPLTDKNAQALVVVQNLDTVLNNIQIVLYGVARRFNWPD